uniref:Uncharacterized protein n=1 Tax=Avena sativa TaxID=4498 RepID=A0ACD5ZRX5_AVESA
MADAGVTGVAAKLGELAAAEATALLRVDSEIRSLRRKLAYLQALVRGADRARRGRANELLLLWLRETREVAFEVEDAVDEFHLRVEAFHLSVKGRRGWWHGAAFNLLQGLATQIAVRHGLSHQIVKINERIDELNQNKETYAIESFPSETWNSSSVETDPEWYEDGYIVDSRQSEFTSLKDQIINKEKNVSHRAVISILGECGIGKKTLARKLYNDPDIMRHFEVHAYLGIRNSNLEELPSSICKLDNLQTLDLRRTNVRRVGDEFWEIETLRHVLAEKIMLPNCTVSLNNLMTLDGVEPANPWHEEICPLNYMIGLRSLSLSSISETHTKALSAALKKMEFLVNLKLSGEVLPSTIFTDSSMRRLQVLILHGKLEDPHASLSDRYIMPNLTMLHLHKSELSQLFVDKLAVLPCIAEMELLYGSYSGTKLVFPERGFQSLRKLKLKNLCTLEELVVEPGAMTMLSTLAMYDCSILKVVNGLNTLEHLQELAVYNMEMIVATIKHEDKKLFDKIKCLTTPMSPTKVDREVPVGSWVRNLGRPAPALRVSGAPESLSDDLESSGCVERKATDDIEVHYSSGGAWVRLAQV